MIDGNGGADFINLDTGGGDTVQMAITAAAGDKNTIDGFTVGAGGDIFDLVELPVQVRVLLLVRSLQTPILMVAAAVP